MKNIEQLRNELADNFNKLKAGEIEVPVASELNNTAGKMIQTVALELKQAELVQSKNPIPFLNYDGKILEGKNDSNLIEAGV